MTSSTASWTEQRGAVREYLEKHMRRLGDDLVMWPVGIFAAGEHDSALLVDLAGDLACELLGRELDIRERGGYLEYRRKQVK